MKCVVCTGESSATHICAECRTDPFWAGISDEVLTEHGHRCNEAIAQGRRWIAQGFAPVEPTPAEPSCN